MTFIPAVCVFLEEICCIKKKFRHYEIWYRSLKRSDNDLFFLVQHHFHTIHRHDKADFHLLDVLHFKLILKKTKNKLITQILLSWRQQLLHLIEKYHGRNFCFLFFFLKISMSSSIIYFQLPPQSVILFNQILGTKPELSITKKKKIIMEKDFHSQRKLVQCCCHKSISRHWSKSRIKIYALSYKCY